MRELRNFEVTHVHTTPVQQLGKLALDADELQAGYVAWLKLHEHVHIAVRAEVVTQDGPEQGQTRDVMPAAEGRHGLTIDRDMRTHDCVDDTPGPMAGARFHGLSVSQISPRPASIGEARSTSTPKAPPHEKLRAETCQR